MNYKILEINTTHGDFSTELPIEVIKERIKEALKTESKELEIPFASITTTYKGLEMDSISTKILDLNEVKIYGYTIHNMTPKKENNK